MVSVGSAFQSNSTICLSTHHHVLSVPHSEENANNYRSSNIMFMNIGNIHAMRESYQRMVALALSPLTPVSFAVSLHPSRKPRSCLITPPSPTGRTIQRPSGRNEMADPYSRSTSRISPYSHVGAARRASPCALFARLGPYLPSHRYCSAHAGRFGKLFHLPRIA